MDSQTDKVNDALHILMEKKNITQNGIAACLAKSQTTVSFRFHGKADWTVSELGKIATLFGFKNLVDFFKFVEANSKYQYDVDTVLNTLQHNEKAA